MDEDIKKLLEDKDFRDRVRSIEIIPKVHESAGLGWGFWAFLIAVAVCIAAVNIAESYFKWKGQK